MVSVGSGMGGECGEWCGRGGTTTMQARTRLCASHMTFNKFQALIAFQSTTTAGRSLSVATLT